jgi:hypothetical protein
MSYLFFLSVLIVACAIWIAVNRIYRTVIRSKNAQIEALQREISGYKEKLAGASPDQAAAKISELERQVGNRRANEEGNPQGLSALTGSQISEWSAKLSTYRVTALYIRSLEHSSDEFRENLYELFHKAGWPSTTVENVGPTTRTTISSRGAQGAALALVEMFRSVGAMVDHQEFPQLFPEHRAIWITVGCKSRKQSAPMAGMVGTIAA